MFDVTLIAADWWSWLVPLVFVVIYLLNHLLSGAKPAQGKPRDQQQRRRPPAGERPLRPGAARPPQQAGQAQLNTEIEQFLKRANQRRMEKVRREVSPTPPTTREPLVAPPLPLREEPLEIEPLERQDFESVEESVNKHLGNRGFGQHLAEEVGQADEEMALHLKQTFDHKLGTLERSSADAAGAPRDVEAPITRADPQASAKALAGLLTNQRDLRQAILLKEILDRPIDRW